MMGRCGLAWTVLPGCRPMPLRTELEGESGRIAYKSGIATNTITLTVGTNAPVSLADPRLTYSLGLLTYTPGTNEFLGTNGQIVTARLSAADTLGNQTTNFAWSFQLELAPVISSNIVFLGSGTPKGGVPKSGGSCNLALVSTNGDYFTLSYTGSCCLTNGTRLVNTNLYTGFARTVVSFTDYPASNTVVALTRPAKLAELLESGTLSSAKFTLLTNSPGGKSRPKRLGLETEFRVEHNVSLEKVLYEDANLLIETTSDSALDLSASLQLSANFRRFRLTDCQVQLTGNASFELDVHALASAAKDLEGSVPVITPIHNIYGTVIGFVPVWVEVVFEVEAGYTAHFEASAEATVGVNAAKTISVGKKWSATAGWQDILDNPPVSLSFPEPVWQIEGAADVRGYLQPKVTLYVYSLAGASADLEPYVELEGGAQLNPLQWDLGLYAGLDSTIGLDLRVWDDDWGELPSMTLNLIPRQTLWHDAGPPEALTPPQITVQPQSQTVSSGSTVSFSVQADGSAPLSYRWYKNGLYVTDDLRITGSGSSTLRIANVQSSDAGTYRVRVANPAGSVNSASAVLTVTTGSGGMVLIPAGSFTMGNCMDSGEGNSSELPLHEVYVSAFYMDRYEVTKALWDEVKGWNGGNGYVYENAGAGKAANHPVHTVNWWDSVKWCNARSQKEGLVPCYYNEEGLTTVYKSGTGTPYVKWDAEGYRLPTEAEWEKAARGGASGHRFPWSDTDNISHSRANYRAGWSLPYDLSYPAGYHPTFNDGVSPYTSPVGYFGANGYGLYDMAGNVCEWCWDWSAWDYYSTSPGTDPRGPESGDYRMVRGGSWDGDTYYCRTAARFGIVPLGATTCIFGFRSVRASGQ